jgi:hypothetical protein
MKTDEELIWENYIISESPYKIPISFPEDLNSSFEDATEQLIIDNGGELYDKYNEILIYNIQSKKDNKTNELYFVKNKKLVAYYRFLIKEDQDCIQTKMIWNSKNHRGIFREIFLNYILPKYKRIQSDDQISERGFQFWEKLLQGGGNYKIYISDNQNMTVRPIENIRDLKNQQQELNTSFQYTTFWILYGK